MGEVDCIVRAQEPPRSSVMPRTTGFVLVPDAENSTARASPEVTVAVNTRLAAHDDEAPPLGVTTWTTVTIEVGVSVGACVEVGVGVCVGVGVIVGVNVGVEPGARRVKITPFEFFAVPKVHVVW